MAGAAVEMWRTRAESLVRFIRCLSPFGSRRRKGNLEGKGLCVGVMVVVLVTVSRF